MDDERQHEPRGRAARIHALRAAVWRWATTALLIGGGALVGLAVAGRTTASIGPFDATLAPRPSFGGETTVLLAPLGAIKLDTHDAPIGIELRVEELKLSVARAVAADPASVESLGDDIASDLRAAMWGMAARCIVAAAIGGAVGAVLARARWRGVMGATGIVALMTAGVFGLSAVTFDRSAIARPRYTGILALAPRAVGDVRTVVERFGEYRVQLTELVGNVARLYIAGEALPTSAPADDSIRLLHVSDIHLNPQAFDVIREVAERFNVSAIADTGDITDWGTEPESEFVGRIASLGIPYVWVRGNHDSPATQAAVGAQPNAVVLDGRAATVAGLRFWGIGDPRYTPNKDQPVGADVEREQAVEFADDVASELDQDEPPDVDIMMIHDQRAASDVGGRVPVVLAGHTHHAREGRIGSETLLLVEGSTGGAGLRALQGAVPEPLTCSVLYVDRATRRVVAYDRITVQGLGDRAVTIERHIPRVVSAVRPPLGERERA